MRPRKSRCEPSVWTWLIIGLSPSLVGSILKYPSNQVIYTQVLCIKQMWVQYDQTNLFSSLSNMARSSWELLDFWAFMFLLLLLRNGIWVATFTFYNVVEHLLVLSSFKRLGFFFTWMWLFGTLFFRKVMTPLVSMSYKESTKFWFG